MKDKAINIILWILSIFFLLSTFIMLSTTWAAILFIFPAILLNPLANQFLKNKFNFNNKRWIQICTALVPIIVYAIVAPHTTTTIKDIKINLSSTTQSKLAITSSLSQTSSQNVVTNSSTISSSALFPTQPSIGTISSNAKLKIHYIDVGQGDSEFLELPNNQTMLIDAGNPENGEQIVSYIKGLGYSKIDYLIATHPHSDHIGGMATVVNNLDIGKIYMPKKSTNTKTFEGLLTAIQRKRLKVNAAQAGVDILKVGNLNINMLAPVNITGDDLNQYSAVIMLTYGDNKFLFMGDAGEPSEEQITADVSADVLKVGHHGSNTATSQSFLNKVKPKYAVIEVGKGNSYGHPTANTLSKLQNIGATIYRTDNDGTIIFTSDAKTITIDKKASSVKQQAPPVIATTPKSNNEPKSHTTIAPSTGNDDTTVYIADTGTKYHTENCRTLRKSKHAITLKEAKAKGYTPCKVCHPPE